MSWLVEIGNLRQKVAALNRSLYETKRKLEAERRHVEIELIRASGGKFGANAEERKLIVANSCDESARVQELTTEVADLTEHIERLNGAIETLRDERRQRELDARNRLCDILAAVYAESDRSQSDDDIADTELLGAVVVAQQLDSAPRAAVPAAVPVKADRSWYEGLDLDSPASLDTPRADALHSTSKAVETEDDFF